PAHKGASDDACTYAYSSARPQGEDQPDRSEWAGPSCASHVAVPLAGDRGVDCADDDGRRRSREALDTLVSEHGDTWEARLRRKPEDVAGARRRTAGTERRRVPRLDPRSHQEPRGTCGNGTRRGDESGWAHELVLFDRQHDVRVA